MKCCWNKLIANWFKSMISTWYCNNISIQYWHEIYDKKKYDTHKSCKNDKPFFISRKMNRKWCLSNSFLLPFIFTRKKMVGRNNKHILYFWINFNLIKETHALNSCFSYELSLSYLFFQTRNVIFKKIKD